MHSSVHHVMSLWTFNLHEIFECAHIKLTVSGQSKQASKQANKPKASEQASMQTSQKQANKQACKQARKQANKQASIHTCLMILAISLIHITPLYIARLTLHFPL